MPVKSTWGCECQRYFVESKEVNSKGNAKTFPIEVRKMRISGDFITTDAYRITLIKRKGERFYCVKERKKPLRPWWDKTPIKEEEYKWIKEGTYTRDQFIAWLRGRIDRPEAAVVELETCPPEDVRKKLAA